MTPLTSTFWTRRRRRVVCGWLTAAVLASLSAGCRSDPATLVGYRVDPAPAVGAYMLTDVAHNDEAFQLRARPGDFLVVYLGFTNCPDACPAAMTEIKIAMDRLGDRADRIDVAMITVDPDRDVGPSFADYVHQFVADGRALRTDDSSELQSIVTAFGATAMTDHDPLGETEVGHTAYTYAVDDAGTVVLTWTEDMTVDAIVNDLEILMR